MSEEQTGPTADLSQDQHGWVRAYRYGLRLGDLRPFYLDAHSDSRKAEEYIQRRFVKAELDLVLRFAGASYFDVDPDSWLDTFYVLAVRALRTSHAPSPCSLSPATSLKSKRRLGEDASDGRHDKGKPAYRSPLVRIADSPPVTSETSPTVSGSSKFDASERSSSAHRRRAGACRVRKAEVSPGPLAPS